MLSDELDTPRLMWWSRTVPRRSFQDKHCIAVESREDQEEEGDESREGGEEEHEPLSHTALHFLGVLHGS